MGKFNKGGWFAVQVTDVRVRKVLPEGKMKAVASVTLDDEFVVHDVRVVEGQNGLNLAKSIPKGRKRPHLVGWGSAVPCP